MRVYHVCVVSCMYMSMQTWLYAICVYIVRVYVYSLYMSFIIYPRLFMYIYIDNCLTPIVLYTHTLFYVSVYMMCVHDVSVQSCMYVYIMCVYIDNILWIYVCIYRVYIHRLRVCAFICTFEIYSMCIYEHMFADIYSLYPVYAHMFVYIHDCLMTNMYTINISCI